MTNAELIAGIATATDGMMCFTVFTMWLMLKRSDRDGRASPAIITVLLAALAWGALWSWQPTLAAMRLAPPPAGQAGAILTLALGLPLLLLLARVRQFFVAAEVTRFVVLGPWRVVYGAALLLMGMLGGLPAGFFWSAGLGDIAIGVWAVSILMRRPVVSRREILAWNVAGLVDLLHVLVLGALHLRPFFLMHPEAPTLNLLPLAGVPLLIAFHVVTLFTLAQGRGLFFWRSAT